MAIRTGISGNARTLSGLASSISRPAAARPSCLLARSYTLAAEPAQKRAPQGWVPTPYVTETVGGAWHTYDIFSRLLKERIVSINGPIDDVLSASIVAQLLFLEAENPEKPINMYINSPGGVVTAGLAIYDTMTYIRPPISTICLGQAASMGSLLLAGGTAGMRLCLPNASVMVHQPSGGYAGQASDIAIHAREILRLRKRLNGIYLRHLNQALADRKRSGKLANSPGTARPGDDRTTASETTTESSLESPTGPGSAVLEAVRSNSDRFIDLDASPEDDLVGARKMGVPWTLAELERLMERDRFLEPEDALAMGIIDRILEKRG